MSSPVVQSPAEYRRYLNGRWGGLVRINREVGKGDRGASLSPTDYELRKILNSTVVPRTTESPMWLLAAAQGVDQQFYQS
jgi:hypothetical protein